MHNMCYNINKQNRPAILAALFPLPTAEQESPATTLIQFPLQFRWNHSEWLFRSRFVVQPVLMKAGIKGIEAVMLVIEKRMLAARVAMLPLPNKRMCWG